MRVVSDSKTVPVPEHEIRQFHGVHLAKLAIYEHSLIE